MCPNFEWKSHTCWNSQCTNGWCKYMILIMWKSHQVGWGKTHLLGIIGPDSHNGLTNFLDGDFYFVEVHQVKESGQWWTSTVKMMKRTDMLPWRDCESSLNIKQSRRKPTRQLCQSVWNVKSLMSLQSMFGMF